MRLSRFTGTLIATCLVLSISPSAQAKAKVTKPVAPSIASISYSKPSNGKVNITIKITLPKNNGGSKITGSKVTAGGKSCTISSTKTSCTIKGLKSGQSFTAKAASKNLKGFSPYSKTFSFKPPTVVLWNAIKKAESYLKYSSFSRSGLIGQLIYEGFSTYQATYGVDSLGVNWKKQAVKMAADYLDTMPFSRSGLIDQLIYEGFSTSQATYAVDEIELYDETDPGGDDGTDDSGTLSNAGRMASDYLAVLAFSRSGLISQLEYEGFSNAEATSGVDELSVDWFEQAVKMAASYLDTMSFSRSGLIGQLIYEGFSSSEATYGVDQNGL